MKILKKFNTNELKGSDVSKCILIVMEFDSLVRDIYFNGNGLLSTIIHDSKKSDSFWKLVLCNYLGIDWNYEQLSNYEIDLLRQIYKYISIPENIKYLKN